MDSEGAQRRLLRVLLTNSDKRGKVILNVREVGRVIGLDPHNTVHLLWRLQKQGLITFREAAGGELSNLRIRDNAPLHDFATPSEVALGFRQPGEPAVPTKHEENNMAATAPPGRDFKRGTFLEWLEAQEEDAHGWVTTSAEELAEAWGIRKAGMESKTYSELRNRLTMMIKDAERSGEVEALREGRRLIGVRLTSHVPVAQVETAPANGTGPATIEPVSERNEPATPILDAYERAKELASDGAASRWLRFATDELAEEALRWRSWARAQVEKVGG